MQHNSLLKTNHFSTENLNFPQTLLLTPLFVEMETPNWNRFSAFGGILNGPEVFEAWTMDNVSFLTPALVEKGNYRRNSARSQVLAFLKEVNDCPAMYGITEIDHVKGVHCDIPLFRNMHLFSLKFSSQNEPFFCQKP